MKKQTALFIVGMHRSGTSAITRVLSLLGASLPQQVTGASPGNETGHWEPERLLDFNEKLLSEAGSAWYDWRAIEQCQLQLSPTEKAHIVDELKLLILDEYGDAPLIVIKEPRISRLLSLYQPAVDAIGLESAHIIALRNPLAVIESLSSRDNMTPAFAQLLWLRHTLDAERLTRGGKRCFVSYEDLIKNWQESVEAITRELQIHWPMSIANVSDEIENFLSPKLNHHHHSAQEVERDRKLIPWVKRTYHAILALSHNQRDESALQELDKIYKQFNQGCKTFGQAAIPELLTQQAENKKQLDKSLQEKNKILEQLAQTRTSLSALELHAVGQDTRISDLEKHNSQLKQYNADLDKHNSHLQVLGSELQQRNEELSNTNDALQQRNEELSNTNDALQQRNEELKNDHIELELEINFLEQQHDELESDVTQFKDLLSDANDKLKDLEHITSALNKERFSVIKPIYRNIYFFAGRTLRRLLPGHLVDRLRSLIVGGPVALHVAHPPQTALALAENIDISPARGKPDLFIFSIIDWHFRIQRPQHLARHLAKHHRVFYIEMTLSKDTMVEKLDESLYRIRISSKGIGSLSAYSAQPSKKQVSRWISNFYQFCDQVGTTSFKQVILQHPFWWSIAQHLPPDYRLIFDCMDDIAGFSNTSDYLLEQEKAMIEGCDAMVVSSQYLLDKYRSKSPLHLIRNGGDLDHFVPATLLAHDTPDFLDIAAHSRKGDIQVGYVGAIAEWFDYELIQAVARLNPDIHFHLCGGVSYDKVNALKALRNVSFYGEIPYSQVPAFLQHMQVLIIPFKLLPIIQACDPVKFYEYSATAKPTVSTRLPELARASELVYFADTATEFGQQIRKAAAASDSPQLAETLRSYALDNTWEVRGKDFEVVIDNLPLVSIVILAYGDPAWTCATLHSLYDGGQHYPHMEVIVVDNGSKPEWLQEIYSAVEGLPNVRIIENGENLGFARGNNVGLRAASGDYVLLLNNDTYLAPGAIPAMVSHLQNNPDIGAVGPLTNNIGNEARIALGYESMTEMQQLARSAVTGYRGLFTPLNVLAYFAVMFRRKDLDVFGLLSEDYGRGMFEDDDHCQAIRSRGFLCALAEDAFVHHHLSATFSTMPNEEKQTLFDNNKVIYESKWGLWKPHRYRDTRPPSRLSLKPKST